MSRRHVKILTIWVFFIFFCSFLIFAEEGYEKRLTLIVGETKIIDINDLVKVAVGDPNIVDIRVLSQDELLINAKGEGVTSIVIWTTKGRETTLVEVRTQKARDERLATEISNAISRKEVKVSVIEGVVILEGELSNDVEIERTEKIAQIYSPGRVLNLIRTPSKLRQVEMEVRIAEVDKSYIQDLGIGEVDGVISFGIIEQINLMSTKLIALSEEGRAKLLAKPNLVALNGHEATFLVGGEVPILVKEEGSISVDWKEYGVRLSIKPTITKGEDGEEYILSTVCTEVSTLDWTNSVKIEGQAMPAIRTRNVDTTLQLATGETLILAGLIQNHESQNINKIPILGDLPILGLLFKSVEFTTNQTELVIFITPSLID